MLTTCVPVALLAQDAQREHAAALALLLARMPSDGKTPSLRTRVSRTTSLDSPAQEAQIPPKKLLWVILRGTTSLSGLDLQTRFLYLLSTQHPIMTVGLSYLLQPEQWCAILSEGHSQTDPSIASFRVFSISLLGKEILNCVICGRTNGTHGHMIFKLTLYCVNGQTHPQELKKEVHLGGVCWYRTVVLVDSTDKDLTQKA